MPKPVHSLLSAAARATPSRIVLASFFALVLVACGTVPPLNWPSQESFEPKQRTEASFLERRKAGLFVGQQIAEARKQPANGAVRKELVEAAEKSHQPVLAKRMSYSPPVISAVVEDVALLNTMNAIVTFKVQSGYPPGYPVLNNSTFTYVYALYKDDGVWQVIATYQLLRASVVS